MKIFQRGMDGEFFERFYRSAQDAGEAGEEDEPFALRKYSSIRFFSLRMYLL